AASVAPEMPGPYDLTLACAASVAEKGQGIDTDTALWAADILMRRDWAFATDERQDFARKELVKLLKALDGKPGQAQRVRELLERDRVRDLVIELVWVGEADLDLEVYEPTGATCTRLLPQTPGGGVLRADELTTAQDKRELYTAAEAFAGTYEVRVKRIWGRPLGNKATLKVTRHRGTADEATQLITLDLTDKGGQARVHLEAGRRTAAASLAQPLPRPKLPAVQTAGQMFTVLRGLAHPTLAVAVSAHERMAGGAAGVGQVPGGADAPELVAQARPMAQNRVAGLGSTPDMVAQSVVTTRTVRLPDGTTTEVPVQEVVLRPVF